jgi:hypothetical protein
MTADHLDRPDSSISRTLRATGADDTLHGRIRDKRAARNHL